MGAELSTSSHMNGGTADSCSSMLMQLQPSSSSSSRSIANIHHGAGSSHSGHGHVKNSIASARTMKPNKVKKNHSYFHSKPSTLVDLIVNKDWQRVMNRCTSHSKEIYVTQKIRLYGVDRKLLPLHIACAMRPPKEVIASLLRPDTKTGMSTAKTLVKNSYKKKKHKNIMSSMTRMKRNRGRNQTTFNTEVSGGTMMEHHPDHPSQSQLPLQSQSQLHSHPQITIQSTASSLTNSISNNTFMDGADTDGHDLIKEVVEPSTCRTAPLSPTTCMQEQDYEFGSDDDDDDDNVDDDDSATDEDDDFFPDYRINTRNQIFFPDHVTNHHRYYALQITPSGQVKQISPHGKSCRSALETESPFVYASLSHTKIGVGDESAEDGQVHATTMESLLADDFLPIHIACLYRASPEVIKLLIHCYPEGVEQKNNWGMLPLHMVCSNYSLEPPNIMASKLDSDFTTKAYLNNLYRASMEEEGNKWEMEKVVQFLVEAFPQSVNIPSDNVEWYTPLEYAARNIKMGQGREEITGILKRAQEQQYSMINRGTGASASLGAGINCDGQSLGSSLSDSRASNGVGIKAFYISDCPLLYTYISGKQWDRTVERLKTAPEEASYWVVDKDYPRLPIHLACSNAAPRDVVECLVHAYPEGCMAKDGSRSHPLHLACEKGPTLETVSLLLKKSRKAARVRDELGRLPLHLACASGAKIAVVKALMDAYPQSCYIKDYNGHTALTYVDYCIDDDRIKNEISSIFKTFEERLLAGDIGRSRNVNLPEDALEDEEFEV